MISRESFLIETDERKENFFHSFLVKDFFSGRKFSNSGRTHLAGEAGRSKSGTTAPSMDDESRFFRYTVVEVKLQTKKYTLSRFFSADALPTGGTTVK
jgi:hypothetical protein